MTLRVNEEMNGHDKFENVPRKIIFKIAQINGSRCGQKIQYCNDRHLDENLKIR